MRRAAAAALAAAQRAAARRLAEPATGSGAAALPGLAPRGRARSYNGGWVPGDDAAAGAGWRDGAKRPNLPPSFPSQQRYTRFRDRPGASGRPSPLQPRPRVASLLGGVTLAGGTIIYFSSREEVPYTRRKHAILVSIDLERQLGEQTFAQIKADAVAKRTLLPRAHPATRAVERVGRRLAAAAADGAGGGYVDHMKGLQWEFIVVDEV